MRFWRKSSGFYDLGVRDYCISCFSFPLVTKELPPMNRVLSELGRSVSEMWRKGSGKGRSGWADCGTSRDCYVGGFQ